MFFGAAVMVFGALHTMVFDDVGALVLAIGVVIGVMVALRVRVPRLVLTTDETASSTKT